MYNGELWAIGFRTLASGVDELTRVPRHVFFTDYKQERDAIPNIYWAKGELTAGSESYFDIHVVRSPVDLGAPAGTSSESRVTRGDRPRTFGRPSTAGGIRDLAEYLLREDRMFQALPNRHAQAEELRARLLGEPARHDHDKVGYKTSVIVRIIGTVARRLARSE